MATAWRTCLAAATLSSIACATYVEHTPALMGEQQHRLAVIVPAYRGDLTRAVSSLERWPATCSSLTQRNVDLVLYYAEEEDVAVEEAAKTIAKTAGQCFHSTRTVYANLDEKDDFYPKGASVQFYKMFLDEEVRSQLVEYDALAIVEWDMLVAADSSFEELYKAAFAGGGDDFWVKGSNVGGTTFHTSAEVQEMWHILGHINGNAIYNNNDPAFAEYVEYTRARWQYDYPYDVALWLTISDFPYSWPLWQRYSSKFVTTNLISYVGTEHVDSSSVSEAVASHTLFIHGSRVDDGNIASRKAASELKTKRSEISAPSRERRKKRKQRKQRKQRLLRYKEDEEALTLEGSGCTRACGPEGDVSGLPEGTSTVCDDSCDGDHARYGGFLCGSGNSDKYGPMCRTCFHDEDEARVLQRTLAENDGGSQEKRVIMCDTMRPPEPVGCTSDCFSKTYTVCDDSCGTGRYGDFDCNWKDYGDKCRFCFDDLNSALVADEIAKRQGGRVIMCSTMEPPVEPVEGELPEVQALSSVRSTRRMQAWRDNEKWKTVEKWKTEEKYKTLTKWSLVLPILPDPTSCLEDDCPYTNSAGTTGRVCDDNCNTGTYGTFGCNAKSGTYGYSCRRCYYDQELAESADDLEGNERAIMCDTVLPVEITYRRRLVDENPANAEGIGRKLDGLKDTGSVESAQQPQAAEVDFVAPPPATRPRLSRKLQAWKDSEKWKSVEKWKTIEKWSLISKFEELQKWQPDTIEIPELPGQEVCLDSCDHTSSNGLRGRVCDDNCATGIYGDFGCGAREGIYGSLCRVCYFDTAVALGVDDEEGNQRAIMCDTVLPVTIYDTRRLTNDPASAENIGRQLKGSKKRSDETSTTAVVAVAAVSGAENAEVEVAASNIGELFTEMSHQLFTEDLTRGEICAFVAAREDELEKWQVTVRSILQFVPGVRVAMAVEGDPMVYYKALGNFPNVVILSTPNAFLAGLYADKYCGPGTSLVYYLEADSVVSRTFTAKDTHSPNGELLVVYSEPRSRQARDLNSLASSVLGFKTPSFTHGADLMLPVEANEDLRELVLKTSDREGAGLGEAAPLLNDMGDFDDIAAVPQIMAALQYSRKPSGIWFFNPQAWVAEHLFKPVSIWEIPLVKPRFACALPAGSRLPDAAEVLQRNLDFFSHGGKCESGVIAA